MISRLLLLIFTFQENSKVVFQVVRKKLEDFGIEIPRMEMRDLNRDGAARLNALMERHSFVILTELDEEPLES